MILSFNLLYLQKNYKFREQNDTRNSFEQLLLN